MPRRKLLISFACALAIRRRCSSIIFRAIRSLASMPRRKMPVHRRVRGYTTLIGNFTLLTRNNKIMEITRPAECVLKTLRAIAAASIGLCPKPRLASALDLFAGVRPFLARPLSYLMLYRTGTMRLALDPISGGNGRPFAWRAISSAAWSSRDDPELATIRADTT